MIIYSTALLALTQGCWRSVCPSPVVRQSARCAYIQTTYTLYVQYIVQREQYSEVVSTVLSFYFQPRTRGSNRKYSCTIGVPCDVHVHTLHTYYMHALYGAGGMCAGEFSGYLDMQVAAG